MSNSQLTTTAKASPLAVMAARFNADPNKLLDTLKATVFKEARNNEELQALVIVANQYGLNPLTKEIYAFPAKGGGIVPVISIDGWANLANSHPQMDGVEFEWQHAGDKLICCTAVIHRKDRAHPVKVTEYLSECRRNTEPWKMEHRMLRHKAFCQGVRIAFGFSGIYDEDEAERITGGMRDVTPPPSAAASKLFKDVALPAEATPVESTSLPDQVRALMKRDGIGWGQVCEFMQVNGEEINAPDVEDASDDKLIFIVQNWSSIVGGVKGGGK